MEKKFGKGTEEWQMFTDFWKLCQSYWVPEDKDEYWEQLMKDADSFCKVYNSEFAKGIALAFINAKERELRDGKRD